MFFCLKQVCRVQLLNTTRLLGRRSASAKAALGPRMLIEKTEREYNNRMLIITWINNAVSRYPFVYLRDNCRCSKCFHETSLQRSYDTVFLDMNIRADRVEVLDGGEQISITWPDKHVSIFNSEWLHSRRLVEDAESWKQRWTLNREGVQFWNAEIMQDKIPRYDFQKLMTDDWELFKWLDSLHGAGIALITGTPPQSNETEKLSRRVGYSKTTHYGHRFEVRSKYDANSLAYTTNFLPLHVDLPMLDYMPGVQLLHCIEQASGKGGENQFVDGFYVAEKLRRKNLKMFELLSTWEFPYCDQGKDTFGEFDKKLTRSMIELNHQGQIIHFSYNNQVRDSIMDCSPEKTIEVYEAYVTISQMMKDPSNQIEYKMTPGDIITFNNTRVLHGRSAFTVTRAGSRYLCGIYLDWDVIYSRMRVLAKRFNVPSLL